MTGYENKDSANRRIKAPDSARWCENCRAWGNHHTDRCFEPSEMPDDESGWDDGVS